MRKTLLLLTIAMATPAQAAPLVFGAINGSEDLSRRSDLGACTRAAEGYECILARTSFGGLPLARGSMTLDARGRGRAVRLILEPGSHDRARELLTGRYGAPTSPGPEPRWTRFDEGAQISVRPERARTVVLFDYPGNDAVLGDGRRITVWTLLALVCLGLAVGAWLRRRTEPVGPASMKETLERRLRNGGDLSF